jgi:histidine ammonia-lyase
MNKKHVEKTESNTSSSSPLVLNGQNLTANDLTQVCRNFKNVEIGSSAEQKILAARKCVEDRVASGKVYYGINTGFGALAETQVSHAQLSLLQKNLIRSHACGVGALLPTETVRGMLLLRLQTMCLGNTGASLQAATLLKDFLNHKIHPHVPSQGSVGACGDLAPLAHLALALLGEGFVEWKGAKMSADDALKHCHLSALEPQAKEGLCLINGTQAMTSHGIFALLDALNAVHQAQVACALSTDAFGGTRIAFRSEIHAVRPQNFQLQCAESLFHLLENSEIAQSHVNCSRVQDPYSFRCAPQVHAASLSALHYALDVLLVECNSSTDNPLVFSDSNEILSGGNFHGQPVALALDFAAIAACEIASISERRIDKLVTPHLSGLPAFLVENPGLNSGFMIPHVVAASLVSQNKTWAHPCSVDSIPTSAEKEDHVSMGMNAALKLREIVQNTCHVLAIELLAGAQGIHLRLPLKTSLPLQKIYSKIRKVSEPLLEDRSLSEDIQNIQKLILKGEFLEKSEI